MAVGLQRGRCLRVAERLLHRHHVTSRRDQSGRVDRRSVPDLVCRFTENCEEGHADDWLVVENKATAVGQAALHQLSRYVDLPARVGAERERVHGLLLADGDSVNLRRGLEEAGLDYLSLTAVGYRDHLRGLTGFVRESDPDATSIPHPESHRDLEEQRTDDGTGEGPDEA